MQSLFICHGRLHLRDLHFLPFLQEEKAHELWETAIDLDVDILSWPDVVNDVFTASKKREDLIS